VDGIGQRGVKNEIVLVSTRLTWIFSIFSIEECSRISLKAKGNIQFNKTKTKDYYNLHFRRSILGMVIKTSSPPSHEPLRGAHLIDESSKLDVVVGERAVMVFECIVVTSYIIGS
jgi:hypothetical protein